VTRAINLPGTLDRKFLVVFKVLTPVIIKSSIFWDVTSCSPLKVNRRFGVKCRLHLQDRIVSQARNRHEADSLLRYPGTLRGIN
jgi:hypothetical protein